MNRPTRIILSLLFVGIAGAGLSQPSVVQPGMFVRDLFGQDAREVMTGVRARGVNAATVRMARIEVQTGHSTPDHNHPDEELILVLEGRIRAWQGDESHDLGPGEVLIIPAYVQHHYEAIESSVTVEVFGPGNRDFSADGAE